MQRPVPRRAGGAVALAQAHARTGCGALGGEERRRHVALAASRAARPRSAAARRRGARPRSRPCSAAPQEMPASTPSRRAARRAVSIASSSSTAMISSTSVGSSTGGTKPAPMPWILCGPGAPPDSTGDAAGSTATTRQRGLRSFRKRPAPVSVPPVPTPATRQSTSLLHRLPDLRPGRAEVRLGVRRVGELVGQPEVVAAGERLGGGDRLVHAAERLRDVELGAVEPQQALALAAQQDRTEQ